MSATDRYTCLVMVLFVLTVALSSAYADSDENDSLASPERIFEGITWGNVTLRYEGAWPNITTVSDDDSYIFSMPPESSVNVTLRKRDLSTAEITVTFYDIEGFRLEKVGMAYVSIPGQSDRVVIENRERTHSDIVMLLRGNGTYTLSIRTSPIEVPYDGDEDRSDGTDSAWIFAPTVTDGTYNGTVAERSDEYVRYYRVMVPKERVLDITLRKTDGKIGIITLETFTPFREPSYGDVSVKVYRAGQSGSDTFDNYGDEDLEKIIRVFGSGNYTITIDTTEKADYYDDEFIILFMVMMLLSFLTILIPLMVPVMVVIVGVVVIIIVVSRTRKTSNGAQSPQVLHDPPAHAPQGVPAEKNPSKNDTSLKS